MKNPNPNQDLINEIVAYIATHPRTTGVPISNLKRSDAEMLVNKVLPKKDQRGKS